MCDDAQQKTALRGGFLVTAESQCLSRLVAPVFIPLGEPSTYAAWRAQYLSRLTGPVFIPLGGPSVYPAWRTQCLSRLADPIFAPLGEPSIDAAWRAQHLRRLAALRRAAARLAATFLFLLVQQAGSGDDGTGFVEGFLPFAVGVGVVHDARARLCVEAAIFDDGGADGDRHVHVAAP